MRDRRYAPALPAHGFHLVPRLQVLDAEVVERDRAGHSDILEQNKNIEAPRNDIVQARSVRYDARMDTPAARLRYLRETKNIGSAAELARQLGIPEVTYRAHESGVRGFGEPQARRYADSLSANWVWLLTGSGEPFAAPAPGVAPPEVKRPRIGDADVGNARIVTPGRADLPVYASAEGGPSGMVVTTDPVDWVVRPEQLMNVRDAFAVYVIGSSMEPRYEQGDMILVHPSRPVARDTDVLLLSPMEDGARAALVKRLTGWTDSHWSVRQYNPPRDYDLARSEWQRAHAIVGRFNRR